MRSIQVLNKVNRETSPRSKAELEHLMGTAKVCKIIFTIKPSDIGLNIRLKDKFSERTERVTDLD